MNAASIYLLYKMVKMSKEQYVSRGTRSSGQSFSFADERKKYEYRREYFMGMPTVPEVLISKYLEGQVKFLPSGQVDANDSETRKVIYHNINNKVTSESKITPENLDAPIASEKHRIQMVTPPNFVEKAARLLARSLNDDFGKTSKFFTFLPFAMVSCAAQAYLKTQDLIENKHSKDNGTELKGYKARKEELIKREESEKKLKKLTTLKAKLTKGER